MLPIKYSWSKIKNTNICNVGKMCPEVHTHPTYTIRQTNRNQCETSRTYQQLTECLHQQDYYQNTHTHTQSVKQIKIFIYIDGVLHNYSCPFFDKNHYAKTGNAYHYCYVQNQKLQNR